MAPPSQASSSPKASRERKDHRFLRPLRPSVKNMLSRPHHPTPSHDRDSQASHLRVREPEERDETSSGSSSHSGSPGGGERSVGKGGEEGEEEEDRGKKGEGRRGIRYHGYGETEVGVVSSNPLGRGRDSLGRGQKPGYFPLKKYPSNDSVSSSSTLVSKMNYDHDENLVDILRSTSGGHGLTQSNVQDHLQSEARKSRRRSRFQQQAEEESQYSYQRKGKFVEGREKRDHRVGNEGRRETRGKEEVDGGEDEGKCVCGGGGVVR